jgi:hypothetical protein
VTSAIFVFFQSASKQPTRLNYTTIGRIGPEFRHEATGRRKQRPGLPEDAWPNIHGAAKQLTVSANVSPSSMWLARGLAGFSALRSEVAVNAIITAGTR